MTKRRPRKAGGKKNTSARKRVRAELEEVAIDVGVGKSRGGQTAVSPPSSLGAGRATEEVALIPVERVSLNGIFNFDGFASRIAERYAMVDAILIFSRFNNIPVERVFPK